MSSTGTTYVIFDADNDKWAYARMKGWNALPTVDFDFEDAHELGILTSRAQDESYVKGELKKRFQKADQVIVLIGESTKNLYRYVRWELDVAQQLDLPIIAVNLDNKRKQNDNLCPLIIRDEFVVHIPYKMKIIKYALENFPSEYRGRNKNESNSGGRYYPDSVYQKLGLNEVNV